MQTANSRWTDAFNLFGPYLLHLFIACASLNSSSKMTNKFFNLLVSS